MIYVCHGTVMNILYNVNNEVHILDLDCLQMRRGDL
jgi:hypothetical protein